MARLLIALVMLTMVAVVPAHAEDIFLAHAQPQSAADDPAALMASVFRHRLANSSHGALKVGDRKSVV